MTGTTGLLPPGQRVHPDHPRYGLRRTRIGRLPAHTDLVEFVAAARARAVFDDAALAELIRRGLQSDCDA